VFHIPKIKNNLVFANFLSKKWLNSVLKSDKVIIIKSEMFVENGYSCDDIYKFSINEINVVSAYMV